MSDTKSILVDEVTLGWSISSIKERYLNMAKEYSDDYVNSK